MNFTDLKTKRTAAAAFLALTLSGCINPHDGTDKDAGGKDTATRDLSEAINADTAVSFHTVLKLQNITFDVISTGEGSIRQLMVKPDGLTADNATISAEIDGSVTNAEIEDLNSDGYPELLIYTASAGSGSYGGVIAYSVNQGKSMSQVYFPSITDNPGIYEGYMGHDEFAVVETSLVQRFPLYKKGDVNSMPTGGYRQVAYKLVNGEASRKFVVYRVTELPAK